MLFQCFATIMMHGDVDLCSSQLLQRLATSLLPTACRKTNGRPLLRSCLCSTRRRLSGEPFKYASLTSILASSSSSLPSIPPSLAFFPDEPRLFFFFFSTRAFADAVSRYSFGSLPLLELAPLPEFWRRSKIRTTKSQRVTSAGLLVRAGNTPTPTPRAAKLSDSAVSLRLRIREEIQAGWGKAAIRNLKGAVGNKSRTDPGWARPDHTAWQRHECEPPSRVFTWKICSKQTVESR